MNPDRFERSPPSSGSSLTFRGSSSPKATHFEFLLHLALLLLLLLLLLLFPLKSLLLLFLLLLQPLLLLLLQLFLVRPFSGRFLLLVGSAEQVTEERGEPFGFACVCVYEWDSWLYTYIFKGN